MVSPRAFAGALLLLTLCASCKRPIPPAADRDVIAGAGPIEQVLAMSSTAYREARQQTVRRFFDVRAWRILERGQGQLDGSDR